MKDPAGDEILAGEGRIGNTLYKKDFWSKENLKYSRPHYRLEKSARIINGLTRGKKCALLDVGCGPATLASLLRPNIQYYGIDIAIHDPAPNLIEADFIETPIQFDGKRFDIVLAQGVFEYMGNAQAQKFTEIAKLLRDGGIFIVSYVNFDHRNRSIYWPYSNVQSLNDFRQSLARHFDIHRLFPTSHNWNHSEPNRKLLKAVNMHINIDVPFISRALAVEYFFICSGRGATKSRLGSGL
jgi:SAM-dependent methyltransferase